MKPARQRQPSAIVRTVLRHRRPHVGAQLLLEPGREPNHHIARTSARAIAVTKLAGSKKKKRPSVRPRRVGRSPDRRVPAPVYSKRKTSMKCTRQTASLRPVRALRARSSRRATIMLAASRSRRVFPASGSVHSVECASAVLLHQRNYATTATSRLTPDSTSSLTRGVRFLDNERDGLKCGFRRFETGGPRNPPNAVIERRVVLEPGEPPLAYPEAREKS